MTMNDRTRIADAFATLAVIGFILWIAGDIVRALP